LDHQSNTLSTLCAKAISFKSNLGGEIIFKIPQKQFCTFYTVNN